MNNMLTRFLSMGLMATLFLSSCDKDEDRVTMNMKAAPKLTASATTAGLVRANAANNAVTYSWSAADFGYQAAVAYTLQFAKAGSNFASNVYEVNVGQALSKTFTVEELNNVYTGVDCNSANKLTKLDVRVRASISPAIGSTSALSSIEATPYPAQALPADAWGIIGSATAGGWDRDTDMTYDFCTRTWKITIALTGDEFKFRANDKWDLNLGDDGNDKELEPNGANIKSPGPGTYEVVLDYNAKPKAKYTITKK
ncbi:SusE domain-containing protein [Hymenobacter weizhouensis]|uniref:SusE domain-containing protein n=1 Tax=Hymenobacter sp. YIM 151500-1 TaxID=2987689 RepID=UPI002225EFE4|nr:SusE domain-containing protein [Hymenobacter sp. YIM 151500-1]UYZ64612.1 SusE domain-containing protein [Hymenobacter sp. YIM 151500-1]